MHAEFVGNAEHVIGFLRAVMGVISGLGDASRVLKMKPRYKLDSGTRCLVVPDVGRVFMEYDRAKFTWAMATEVLHKPSKEVLSSKYGFNITSDGSSKVILGIPLCVAYMIVTYNLDFSAVPNTESNEFCLLEILLFAVLLGDYDSGTQNNNMAFVYLQNQDATTAKPSLVSVLVEDSLVREQIEHVRVSRSDSYTEMYNQILGTCRKLFFGLVYWITRWPQEKDIPWDDYVEREVATQARHCLKLHAQRFSEMATRISLMYMSRIDCAALPTPFDTGHANLITLVKIAYKNNMTREAFMSELCRTWSIMEVFESNEACDRCRDKYYVRKDAELRTVPNRLAPARIEDSLAAAKHVVEQSNLQKTASKMLGTFRAGYPQSSSRFTSGSQSTSGSQPAYWVVGKTSMIRHNFWSI